MAEALKRSHVMGQRKEDLPQAGMAGCEAHDMRDEGLQNLSLQKFMTYLWREDSHYCTNQIIGCHHPAALSLQ